MTVTKRSQFGFFAEDLAVEFLIKRGHELIDRNYRKPWGEIDIITKDGDVLCFVEVKASKESHPGFEPELRAGEKKMHKVVRSAQIYLANKKYGPEQEWRIDLITIVLDRKKGVAKIRHFKNIDAK